MQPMTTERHGNDGAFIRIIDRELEDHERWIPDHVAQCATCARRLAELERHSRSFSTLLARTIPAPVERDVIRPVHRDMSSASLRLRRVRRWWKRGDVRVAAAILLFASAAAASPARAWIADQIARIRGEQLSPRPEANRPVAKSPATQAPPSGQAASSVVGFKPEASTLVVRFAARPFSGTLTLVATEGDRVFAEVVSAGGEESFLVLPSELRIRNSQASVAHYRVTLPSGIRLVVVRVGGGAAAAEEIVVTPKMRREILLGSRR